MVRFKYHVILNIICICEEGYCTFTYHYPTLACAARGKAISLSIYRLLSVVVCMKITRSRDLDADQENNNIIMLFNLGEYSPNDKLFGYTVDSVTQVPDFNLVAIQLHHDKTGAQHLHICRNDSNNCFRYLISNNLHSLPTKDSSYHVKPNMYNIIVLIIILCQVTDYAGGLNVL